MIWLSRLESTANKHRLAVGKAVRTVKASTVLDEVLGTYNQEALSQDTPGLLTQAVRQLLEGDWRAQPKHKANWHRYWRGMSLPNSFVYEGAIVPMKTTSEIAWHPWLAPRITGQLTLPIKARLQQLNTYLFRQTGSDKTLFPGLLGHRERSLLIFGDEKALDSMPPEGWKHVALTLADMGAFRRAPPLPYESSGRRELPAIIVENSDVYYRLCQLNRAQTRWSLVIYGAGNKVSGQAECVAQLLKIEQVKQLLYFGDLDVAGLKIAHQLLCKLRSDYGISLHLDEWLYNELILNGLMTPEGNANNERFDFELQCWWIPQFVLREMKTLLATHQRLPQEGVASLGLVI
ncbi:Wadjet anti-phage system protein JetD domain-containing protein [Dryocola boscaweniae]|uniref:Wadjet anti-phage system protein JetD domain-containing protein n=1 Tax=Dryocola boscaweniae TaxID=2925397 RepID=UPI002FDE4CC6